MGFRSSSENWNSELLLASPKGSESSEFQPSSFPYPSSWASTEKDVSLSSLRNENHLHTQLQCLLVKKLHFIMVDTKTWKL